MLGDKNISREQLDIMGRVGFMMWDDSFIAPEANRTYVLMRATHVDTVQGLGYGYYVFVVYGQHQWQPGNPEHKPFTVTSATFFKDDDRLYCGTTADRVANQHFANLQNAHNISRLPVVE